MERERLQAERERLAALLDNYETGRIPHQGEYDRGELARDITPERIERLYAQVEEIGRQLARDYPDARRCA